MGGFGDGCLGSWRGGTCITQDCSNITIITLHNWYMMVWGCFGVPFAAMSVGESNEIKIDRLSGRSRFTTGIWIYQRIWGRLFGLLAGGSVYNIRLLEYRNNHGKMQFYRLKLGVGELDLYQTSGD